MKPADQPLLKIALQIHQQLTVTRRLPPSLDLPKSRWQHLGKLFRQTMTAEQRGWSMAGEHCRQYLVYSLQKLKADLSLLESAFASEDQAITVQSNVPEMIGDIRALHDEFDLVEIDPRHRTLSVTTESIELEGVYLGPFQIELCWKETDYGNGWRYRIVAEDPHPAATNEEVTHPHVQGETLCEGEGTQPIQSALKQGRLFDFFILVANILRTYNPGSPYVELKDWQGITCSECGDLMNADESSTCEGCSTRLCNDCRSVCRDCEEDFCIRCLQRCACCEEDVCQYCVRACCDCHQQVCSECFTDQERCENCHETETNAADPTPEESPHAASNAETPVQPNGLGQTAVPA